MKATCIDCSATAPESPDSTLSARGWRLMREQQGRAVWRCPACWAKHKASHPPSLGAFKRRRRQTL
ncbi:MAG TPA: hypothetical protein VE987_18305 [Polyangiaceae bacterium]|nr:hypothetical protein [Polyangiaceae bacterium]